MYQWQGKSTEPILNALCVTCIFVRTQYEIYTIRSGKPFQR